MTSTIIAGIIIRNKKLLLVKGKSYEELWTPGGKVEFKENDEQCLRRELKEEINAELKKIIFFKEYSGVSFYHPNKKINQRIYIATVTGQIKPNTEIEKIIWLSKKDFKNKKYKIIPMIDNEIIEDLIKSNIF